MTALEYGHGTVDHDVDDTIQDDDVAENVDGTDEHDGTSQDDDVVDEAVEKPKAPAKAPARRRSGPDRGLVRRVAAKTVELIEADNDDVALLATMLGTDADPVSVTTAVMMANRNSLSALTDVEELLGGEQVEVAVKIMGMGKPRLRGLWGVLHHVGVLDSATPPNSDAKAALAVAAATTEVTSDVTDRLTRVAELGKKGW